MARLAEAMPTLILGAGLWEGKWQTRTNPGVLLCPLGSLPSVPLCTQGTEPTSLHREPLPILHHRS